MQQYTTGELARLCGVSVRCVQYYDKRGILCPSALSEGGRRLYSEDDLAKMRIICFLRDTGISIGGIEALLAEEDPRGAIAALLDAREADILGEMEKGREMLDTVHGIRRKLNDIPHFTVDSLGDIAYTLKGKRHLRCLHMTLLAFGIPLDLLQLGAILLWIFAGIWWPFALWGVLLIPAAIFLTLYYFRRVAYICPVCHKIFKPTLRQAFFARHTPTLRKLTCPHCEHNGFCIEVYRKENEDGTAR